MRLGNVYDISAIALWFLYAQAYSHTPFSVVALPRLNYTSCQVQLKYKHIFRYKNVLILLPTLAAVLQRFETPFGCVKIRLKMAAAGTLTVCRSYVVNGLIYRFPKVGLCGYKSTRVCNCWGLTTNIK